jgi:hypothetical protein
MTAPSHPPAARCEPGAVVQVRLSGDLLACDVLTAVLAAYPGVQVTGQPRPRRNRRDPGHRLYLTLHLALPEGALS